jgi:hypothetical protein
MCDALQHPFLRQKAEVEPLVSFEQVSITNCTRLLNLLRSYLLFFGHFGFQIAGWVRCRSVTRAIQVQKAAYDVGVLRLDSTYEQVGVRGLGFRV